MAKISVLVPVDHNTVNVMRALAAQTVRDDLEVVVVDAHADVHVYEEVARAGNELSSVIDVRTERIPPAGRAACLNRALNETSAPLILVLGDDCAPTPSLVERHLAFHERRPEPHVAGVGPSVFPERLRGSRFRRWLEDTGSVFGVRFPDPDEAQIRHFFYVGNSSLKRSFLAAAGPFEESFPHHAWDDYEMGLRLFEAGMEIEYLPDAIALHEHEVSFIERCMMTRQSGESAALFDVVRPEGHGIGDDPRVSTFRVWARGQRSLLKQGMRVDPLTPLYMAPIGISFLWGYRRGRRGEADGR